MTVKVKKIAENAVIPQKAHKSDAGFDLTVSSITTEINEVGELIIVYHTGLCIEIPDGYYGHLVSRSSVSKKPITLVTGASVIDSGYRGEVVAKFRCTVPAIVPTLYKPGERFAQLIILPVPEIEIEEAETLGDSDRGENGLGSTGDKAFTANDEQDTSAPTATESLPETEVETINSQPANEGSGDAENSVEEAQ